MQIDINLTTKTMFQYQLFREELNSLKHLGLGLISLLNLFGIFNSLPFSSLSTLSLYTCERVL